MTHDQKIQISEQLKVYCGRYESQNAAARSLKDVSSATISHCLQGKWELIKAEMWRNIASQIDFSQESWELVRTRDFDKITHFLKDAQENSLSFAIVGEAGSGKSKTCKSYVAQNKRAYLLGCNEYWNRKYFLSELLQEMGRDSSGLTVADMMYEVVSTLKKQDSPIIIMDEADKLTDQVLYFFITLYNQLEDHCGLVLIATDHLAKKIKRGLKLNKKGYKEIYSRLGRKFIELQGVGHTDVVQVCAANGIEDKNTIKSIWDECENDLRRVKIKVHAVKKSKNK